MARLIDVSLPIGPDLMTWPGDPGVEVVPSSRRSRGDPANVSQLRLGSHTGTHVDPPWHFVDDGVTIDEVPVDVLSGEAEVADLRAASSIGPDELDALDLPEGTTRLLCQTRNSELWARLPVPFPEEYVAVTPDGARWLTEHGIRLVGVDFLSVEIHGEPDFPVHHHLLGNGTIIVEGLDLSAAEPGRYTVACFPLKIAGGDGGPARAVLLEP
ncbi:MAG: cyclase family protein [Actinomycetota bacterium]